MPEHSSIGPEVQIQGLHFFTVCLMDHFELTGLGQSRRPVVEWEQYSLPIPK